MPKKRAHNDDDDEEEELMVEDENRENASEDADADEDDTNHRRKKKKHKSKKLLMTQSGQTENDRRILRRKQRELHQDIALGGGGSTAANGDDDEAAGGGEEDIHNLRQQNNELWDDVRYTREAVLDSENVDLIASKAARAAEKIVQVPRYDAIRLAQSLVKKGSVRKGSTTQFNWRNFGLQVGLCFNALPSHVSFLYGPLDAEYTPKERKKAERKKKSTQEDLESENEEEEKPEDVSQTDKNKGGDGNELGAVSKHIKVISKTLYARAKEEHGEAKERVKEYENQLSRDSELDESQIINRKKKFITDNSNVDAVGCLFNPKSFTQTVENVFHFSFLVKESQAGIKARSAKEVEEFGGMPGPVVRPEKTGPDMPTPKQAIVSLNMKDWKDMCKAYQVEESDVPHRMEGKVAKFEKKKSRKSR